jgi:hypothetical protein
LNLRFKGLALLTDACQAKPDKWALENAMNWSMYTVDRTTHLKIVVVGLTAALLIAVIGIAAQQFNLGTDIMTAQGPTVIKAGAPVVFSDRSGPVIH